MKFLFFFEKHFFKKSSRLVKVIFAAIDKSASKKIFHLENPEISPVFRPKFDVTGGGQSARGIVTKSKKSLFSCFFIFFILFYTSFQPCEQHSATSLHFEGAYQGFFRYHKTTNVTIHNSTILTSQIRITYNDTIVVYNSCYNSQKLVKHKGKSG